MVRGFSGKATRSRHMVIPSETGGTNLNQSELQVILEEELAAWFKEASGRIQYLPKVDPEVLEGYFPRSTKIEL